MENKMKAVHKFLSSLFIRFQTFNELLEFLWNKKLWYLIPVILIVMIIIILVIFGQSTGIGPFLYPLF